MSSPNPILTESEILGSGYNNLGLSSPPDNLNAGSHLQITAMCNSCGYLVAKSWPTILRPHGTVAHQAPLWVFPGENTGVGCHSFSRGSSPPRDWILCLLHWQVGSLPLSHQRSPVWQRWLLTCVSAWSAPAMTLGPYKAGVFVCVCGKPLQLYPTLCDPMDCSLPGSSVHGILQARILEWVAMPSPSRRSSWHRDQTYVFCGSCIAGRFFSPEPPGKPQGFTIILIPICTEVALEPDRRWMHCLREQLAGSRFELGSEGVSWRPQQLC